MGNDTIFGKACLLQLGTRMWQGQKMVAPAVMEQLGDSAWLKGRKHLVDPEHLAPIKACVSRARVLLRRQALPFPLDGLTLVPKEAIPHIEQGLQDIQREFWDAVLVFVDEYQIARHEAEQALGALFSEADYPLSIRDRFGFEWRYVHLSLPGRSRILPAELYAREREKFVSLMDSAREEAIATLREEFAGLVGHLVERLAEDGTDRPKVLHASMVAKLTDFLDAFSARNLFDDARLEELVTQARNIVGGVGVEALRSNDDLRQRIGGQMQAVKAAIDDAVAALPRRRILIAA